MGSEDGFKRWKSRRLRTHPLRIVIAALEIGAKASPCLGRRLSMMSVADSTDRRSDHAPIYSTIGTKCPNAAAGLDGDENRRKPLEVADHLGSPKLAADNHHLVLINTVKLENRLRSIHTDPNRKIYQTFLSSSCHAESAIEPWGSTPAHSNRSLSTIMMSYRPHYGRCFPAHNPLSLHLGSGQTTRR